MNKRQRSKKLKMEVIKSYKHTINNQKQIFKKLGVKLVKDGVVLYERPVTKRGLQRKRLIKRTQIVKHSNILNYGYTDITLKTFEPK